MSKLEISFAELHGPLFFAGKNHGMKLDAHKNPDMKLHYDRSEKELIVGWKGKIAIIPSSNIVSMTEGNVDDRKVVQPTHPMVAGVASAQVETPMSHVHKGQGFGKDGRVKL